MDLGHSRIDPCAAPLPQQRPSSTDSTTTTQKLLALLDRNGPARLCDRCKGIPVDLFAPTSNGPGNDNNGDGNNVQKSAAYCLYPGTGSLPRLENSAAAGCQLCYMLHDALKTSHYYAGNDSYLYAEGFTLYSIHRPHRPSILGIMWRDQEVSESAHLGLRLISLPLDGSEVEVEVGDDKDIADSEPNLLNARRHRTYDQSVLTETEADSPANRARIARWLDTCLKTHPHCRDTAADSVLLPKRLLDVGEAPGQIRLCLSSSFTTAAKSNIQYAALSHCWGATNKPPMTKKTNLASHLAGFPDTMLPRTLFDAVDMTRQLGLRFLWIDSLCIVQDDAADFEQECARMNLVYKRAAITFSASDAHDCTEGLFASRTMQQLPLVWHLPGGDPERRLVVFVYPASPGPWSNGIDGPLQKRAWVLQEREFSPRITHFTKRCLMWECRTTMASEYMPRMIPKLSNSNWIYPQLSVERLLDLKGPESQQTEDGYRHNSWYTVVCQYSHRNLTVPEDRLPAIAGIAAEWKQKNPYDEYLAGLWKSDIFGGLMWCPDNIGGQQDTTRINKCWPPPSKYNGIPTWSWASYNGPVYYNILSEYPDSVVTSGNNTDNEPLCPPKELFIQLEAASTMVEGQNPFGHVSRGELTLSGWIITEILSEEHIERPSQDGPKSYLLFSGKKAIIVDFDYEHPCLPRTELLLLLVNAWDKPLYDENAVGLVLLQDKVGEEPGRQVYRRVGTFSTKNLDYWSHRQEWRTVTIV